MTEGETEMKNTLRALTVAGMTSLTTLGGCGAPESSWKKGRAICAEKMGDDLMKVEMSGPKAFRGSTVTCFGKKETHKYGLDGLLEERTINGEKGSIAD